MRILLLLSAMAVAGEVSADVWGGQEGAGSTSMEAQRLWDELEEQGECFVSVLESSAMSCSELMTSEDAKSRLAIGFSNCHLALSGLGEYPCAATDSLSECIQPMVETSYAFPVFTQYKLHVDVLCLHAEERFLQRELKQSASLAAKALRSLSESLHAAEAQLHELEAASAEGVRATRERLDGLSAATEFLGRGLKDSLTDLYDQQAAFGLLQEGMLMRLREVLDLLASIMRAVRAWEGVMFYLAAVFCIMGLTLLRRTRRARSMLLALLVATFVADRLLVAHVFHSQQFVDPQAVAHELSVRVRQTFTWAAALILARTWFTHKDDLAMLMRTLSEISLKVDRLDSIPSLLQFAPSPESQIKVEESVQKRAWMRGSPRRPERSSISPLACTLAAVWLSEKDYESEDDEDYEPPDGFGAYVETLKAFVRESADTPHARASLRTCQLRPLHKIRRGRHSRDCLVEAGERSGDEGDDNTGGSSPEDSLSPVEAVSTSEGEEHESGAE